MCQVSQCRLPGLHRIVIALDTYGGAGIGAGVGVLAVGAACWVALAEDYLREI